jgi:hypothetical protein
MSVSYRTSSWGVLPFGMSIVLPIITAVIIVSSFGLVTSRIIISIVIYYDIGWFAWQEYKPEIAEAAAEPFAHKFAGLAEPDKGLRGNSFHFPQAFILWLVNLHWLRYWF